MKNRVPSTHSLLSSCSTFRVPSLISYLCPGLPARVVSLFSCQTFLNSVGLRPRFLDCDLRDEDSRREVTALMPISPRLVGSHSLSFFLSLFLSFLPFSSFLFQVSQSTGLTEHAVVKPPLQKHWQVGVLLCGRPMLVLGCWFRFCYCAWFPRE